MSHFELAAALFIIIDMSRDQLMLKAYPVTSSKDSTNTTGHTGNSSSKLAIDGVEKDLEFQRVINI